MDSTVDKDAYRKIVEAARRAVRMCTDGAPHGTRDPDLCRQWREQLSAVFLDGPIMTSARPHPEQQGTWGVRSDCQEAMMSPGLSRSDVKRIVEDGSSGAGIEIGYELAAEDLFREMLNAGEDAEYPGCRKGYLYHPSMVRADTVQFVPTSMVRRPACVMRMTSRLAACCTFTLCDSVSGDRPHELYTFDRVPDFPPSELPALISGGYAEVQLWLPYFFLLDVDEVWVPRDDRDLQQVVVMDVAISGPPSTAVRAAAYENVPIPGTVLRLCGARHDDTAVDVCEGGGGPPLSRAVQEEIREANARYQEIMKLIAR